MTEGTENGAEKGREEKKEEERRGGGGCIQRLTYDLWCTSNCRYKRLLQFADDRMYKGKLEDAKQVMKLTQRYIYNVSEKQPQFHYIHSSLPPPDDNIKVVQTLSQQLTEVQVQLREEQTQATNSKALHKQQLQQLSQQVVLLQTQLSSLKATCGVAKDSAPPGVKVGAPAHLPSPPIL